jgi:hypothetical protein
VSPLDDERGNLLMYCPGCGQHFAVFGGWGQWIASCGLCDDRLCVCWDESHTKRTRDTHEPADLEDLPSFAG